MVSQLLYQETVLITNSTNNMNMHNSAMAATGGTRTHSEISHDDKIRSKPFMPKYDLAVNSSVNSSDCQTMQTFALHEQQQEHQQQQQYYSVIQSSKMTHNSQENAPSENKQQEEHQEYDRLRMNSDLMQDHDHHHTQDQQPSATGKTSSKYLPQYDDIGFDFESSDDCNITSFQDLPCYSNNSNCNNHSACYDVSSSSHFDSECERYEGSTCSSSYFSDSDDSDDSDSDSDDDDSDDELGEEKNFDSNDDNDEVKGCVLSTSTISLLSLTLESSANESVPDDDTDINSQRKRIVRFSTCIVTEVRTRPFTQDKEWHSLYYSAHELQRMIDQAKNNDFGACTGADNE